MSGLAVDGVGGFHPRFAERRVGVDGAAEFGNRQLGADHGRGFGDQFRRVGADGGGAAAELYYGAGDGRVRMPFFAEWCEGLAAGRCEQ